MLNECIIRIYDSFYVTDSYFVKINFKYTLFEGIYVEKIKIEEFINYIQNIKELKWCLLHYKEFKNNLKGIIDYRIKLGDVKIECQIVEEKEKNK